MILSLLHYNTAKNLVFMNMIKQRRNLQKLPTSDITEDLSRYSTVTF